MPSPSPRLAQFRRLLSSETKVPVRPGGWSRSAREEKAQLQVGNRPQARLQGAAVRREVQALREPRAHRTAKAPGAGEDASHAP